jgi:hypothetical protein
MRYLTTTLLALGAAGCLSTPSDPTWVDDVRPILAANCVRCHNAPATGGAPDSFRLDVYEDVTTDAGRVVRGAASMAEFIFVRTDAQTMPPRFPLDQRQRDILANWRLDGVDLGGRPPRGDRPSGAPTFDLLRPLSDSVTDDGRLELLYEIRDPDRDLVRGELRVGADAANAVVVSTSLISGRGSVTWDVAAAADGDYKLFAVLDDGPGQDVTIEIATHSVSNATNTAPTVTLAAPALYDILSDADSPFGVRFTVADPDAADTLTATVTAVRGDETITIATGTPVTVGENAIPWDTTGVTAGNGWRVTVTIDDGTRQRSATARDLVISHTTTSLTFSDVETILAFRCLGCHPGADRIPDLTHDFSSYDDIDDVKGVYSTRGVIYRRVAIQRNMPPKAAAVFGDDPLTANEASTLSEWLLAGAPQ